MGKFSNKQKVYYDKKSDALWFVIKSGIKEEHREIAPGINIEFGEKGELFSLI